MRIEFTQDYEVQDGSGKVYEKGHKENMVTPSALHFINRGVAIEASDAAPKKKKASAPQPTLKGTQGTPRKTTPTASEEEKPTSPKATAEK